MVLMKYHIDEFIDKGSAEKHFYQNFVLSRIWESHISSATHRSYLEEFIDILFSSAADGQ